jgi:MFS family permease
MSGTLAHNLAKLAAVRFFLWMHLFAAVIVPFFRDWGGLGFAAIFLVQAWFMVWSFVLEVPTGAVADRFGRRVSVALGAFVGAVGALVYASVPALPVFLLGEVIFATAMTLVSGADEALAYDTLLALGRSADATRVISRLEAWKLGGMLVGALLGAAAAGAFGPRAPMLLQPVPGVVAGLLALTLVEPASHADVAARPGYLAVFREGMRHLAGSPVLRTLALDVSANAAVVWLVVWLYQAQLGRAGLPLWSFGVVHAGLTLAQIALLARVSSVEALVGGHRRLVRLTALLPPLCLLGLAATAHPVASVALSVAAGAFGFARMPLFAGDLNRHIPSERRATVLSAVSAVRTLGVAVLYPVFGFLVDRSLPLSLAVLGGVGVLVAVLAAAPRAALDAPAAQRQTSSVTSS